MFGVQNWTGMKQKAHFELLQFEPGRESLKPASNFGICARITDDMKREMVPMDAYSYTRDMK